MISTSLELPRYDIRQSYDWNYDHAPLKPPTIDVRAVPGEWTFCGRPVSSPLGIAAGPLLNGRWVLYYAALGFDVLTYKTTRSAPRACYPLPNLQPVMTDSMPSAGLSLPTADEMHGSWAISFGMPSKALEVWRRDVEWTRSQLAKDKLLVVSVVGTATDRGTLDDLAADFARCARWAVASGADAVETNFSCPNVSSADGQLFQQPASAALVAATVRQAIGTTPYLVKIGYIPDEESTAALVAALTPHVDALSMTNSLSATVHTPNGEALFGGQLRGIGGNAILKASVAQVSRFRQAINAQSASLRLIGVGGVSTADHVQAYLQAGAECVQLATAVMVDPLVGINIRAGLHA